MDINLLQDCGRYGRSLLAPTRLTLDSLDTPQEIIEAPELREIYTVPPYCCVIGYGTHVYFDGAV